jgi:folylpolyglutamate synthase/dihydropteroate synthase
MGTYHNNVSVRSDLERAIELAMEIRGDMNILVTGSFRTAEGVLRWIQRKSA